MEELKLLVESIANLPDLAIWVIAMYFFFKLAIVGSLFGVIRLVVIKIYNYFNNKTEAQERETELNNSIKMEELEQVKNRPIEHIHKLGSLSLSSSEDMTGKLVELFTIIKDNTDAWNSIHANDINKAITKLKKTEKES